MTSLDLKCCSNQETLRDSTARIPLIKADLPALEELETEFREILANGRITNFGTVRRSSSSVEAGAYLGAPARSPVVGDAGLLIMTLQALDMPRGQPHRDPQLHASSPPRRPSSTPAATPVFVDVGGGSATPIPATSTRLLAAARDVTRRHPRAHVRAAVRGRTRSSEVVRDAEPRARRTRSASSTTPRMRSDRRAAAGASAPAARPRCSRVRDQGAWSASRAGWSSSRDPAADRADPQDAQLRHRGRTTTPTTRPERQDERVPRDRRR